jgi:hypothetical protein
VAFHQVDDPFANVGDAVTDALQVVGDPDQVRCPLDVCRVFDHVADELVVELVV